MIRPSAKAFSPAGTARFNVSRAAPRSAAANDIHEEFSNALSLGSTILFLMAQWQTSTAFCLHASTCCLVLSGIIVWRTIPAIGRAFAMTAGAATLYMRSPIGPDTSVLENELVRGVGFASLLSILGIFRGIIHKMPVLRQTIDYLLT